MYILPRAMLKAFLLAVEGSGTLFPSGYTLRLYTNNLTPLPTSVVGDFTELTNVEVPGYTPATPTWNAAPYANNDGSWTDNMTLAPFTATGAASPPTTVYGWFLTDSGKTTLLGAGLLDAPFTFSLSGDGFTMEGNLNVAQPDGDHVSTTLGFEQA